MELSLSSATAFLHDLGGILQLPVKALVWKHLSTNLLNWAFVPQKHHFISTVITQPQILILFSLNQQEMGQSQNFEKHRKDSCPKNAHESPQHPETSCEFPIALTGTRGDLATPIPASFGPFAWSGNQFGHKHFSPQLYLGREGSAEPSGMMAGCLQISHSHPLSKSQEAEGNWGCGGKGGEGRRESRQELWRGTVAPCTAGEPFPLGKKLLFG